MTGQRIKSLFSRLIIMATSWAFCCACTIDGPTSTARAENVSFDFTQIDGFSAWSSSYTRHVLDYQEATITLESANRQTQVITDMPVTKGGDITIVLKDGLNMRSASLLFQAWNGKPQTISLLYSTDGRRIFSPSGISSSIFSISAPHLPAGTNAIRIRFSSSSNQIGLQSATLGILGSSSGSVQQGGSKASVETDAAIGIGMASATLSARFSDTSTIPDELGFQWGSSAGSLGNELYVGSGHSNSGSFSKELVSLSAGRTYFYRAYVRVGSDYFYGSIRSFSTERAQSGSGVSIAGSWLEGNEIPSVSVSVGPRDLSYEGRYCHSTAGELYGGTRACIYNTSIAGQRIVTHTFSYDGKVLPSYTLLYDSQYRCALWEAFTMGGPDYTFTKVGRNERWAPDPALPEEWQPMLANSYRGYSRGHQVASSDRQTTPDQNAQTFYYSNMTPQSQVLNGGSWNALEKDIQNHAARLKADERLFVVTGPIFGSGYLSTTDRSGAPCPVPTQYFKCVLQCTLNADGDVIAARGAAFLFDHDGSDSPRQEVSIDHVESLTGFDFYVNVPDTFEEAAERVFSRLF